MSNSDIKMSDAFAGNVVDQGNSLIDAHCITLLEGQKWAILAAKKAISSHDALVEQNKALREIIGSLLDSFQAFDNQSIKAVEAATKALEQAQ